MRNPGDGDQGFRREPITDSEAWRSRIPMDADQGFRGMAITQRPTPYPESLLTTLDNLSQVGHDPLHLIEEAVMSQARLSMRKIEEILRLKWEAKRSHREIATSCGISSSTVSDYLNGVGNQLSAGGRVELAAARKPDRRPTRAAPLS